mmetsp:Transcript_50835/g.80650  ORF Transcript_50835/g.80650 Transcript_50835/m.80650 type:complete len:185 (-) Transcript_50835:219-773(-)
MASLCAGTAAFVVTCSVLLHLVCGNSATSLLQVNFRAETKKLNTTIASAGETKNVLGTALQTCSTDGTAMTGFTRDGKCQDEGDDDAGSHHVCIVMERDFCTVTGQPNWCEEKSECMGQSGMCDIKNWCVCQWAFATYLQMAGGCDGAVDLKCEATNMAAVKAYEESTDPSHKEALACIKKKCP